MTDQECAEWMAQRWPELFHMGPDNLSIQLGPAEEPTGEDPIVFSTINSDQYQKLANILGYVLEPYYDEDGWMVDVGEMEHYNQSKNETVRTETFYMLPAMQAGFHKIIEIEQGLVQ